MSMTTKQRILSLLEQHKGASISGEALAEQLSLTRAAVWKAIKELQKAGHAIDAVSGAGYTLRTESNLLSAEGIRPYLRCNCPDADIIVEQVLESTNITAKQLGANGAAHGTAVLAEMQTAGRGRRGRSFTSPPGTGLYLSVVLRSNLTMESAAHITSAAAVAACRALHTVCGKDDVQIKWVNDLYCNGKKCCGILTEASADCETGGVDFLVVGIGLNLLPPKDGFPPEVAQVATAIFPEGDNVPRCRLAAEIINELIALCDALPDVSFMEEYRTRNLVPGCDIFILQNGQSRPAHAVAITDDAHLVVRLPDGTEETLSYGEVSVRTCP